MSRNVFQVYASALKKWRKKTLNLIIDSLLQIVFPTRCPGCDKVLAVGERGFAADVQSSFIFCRSLCAPIVENRSIGIRCAAQIVEHIHIALQRGEQYFCIQGKCRSQWRDLSREAEQNTAKYMEGYYGMPRENGCSVSENRCSFQCRP